MQKGYNFILGHWIYGNLRLWLIATSRDSKHAETPTKKMKLIEFLVGKLYKELKIYSSAGACVPLC